MILYHGTTHDIAGIDVTRGKPFKDFGQGFYATPSYDHAANIAGRNRRIEIERNEISGKAADVKVFVCTYSVTLKDLDKLIVKRFETPTAEWVDFVVRNRTVRDAPHEYDLIIGATANDDTRITIQNYLFGAYGEPGTDEAVAGFLKNIRTEKLPIQWLFATQRAADLLSFEGKEQLQ
ncbi:MAG: DUF3990 domain-containing protein [Peptococcaceae bacterium]|jgi:hypothetical protein|nr:DUF3990 domain-containing protein [Peptococcaceae bacterium]